MANVVLGLIAPGRDSVGAAQKERIFTFDGTASDVAAARAAAEALADEMARQAPGERADALFCFNDMNGWCARPAPAAARFYPCRPASTSARRFPPTRPDIQRGASIEKDRRHESPALPATYQGKPVPKNLRAEQIHSASQHL